MTKRTTNVELEAPDSAGMTQMDQAELKQALDARTEQLDFSVLSELNQRRQIALAQRPNVKVGWLGAFWLDALKRGQFTIPAALACATVFFVLTFALRSMQPAISDADAALLADFDSVSTEFVESAASDDALLGLNDDDLALMSQLEFYAWLDQQQGI